MLGRMSSDAHAREFAGSTSAVRVRPALFAVAGLALLVAAWYAAQVVVLDHSARAAVTATPARTTAPVGLDEPIVLNVHGAGVQIESARLVRAMINADGSRSTEQSVPVRLDAAADEGTWRVVSPSGSRVLNPDGAYRLTVSVSAPRPALPLPRTSTFSRDFTFSTVPSPQAAMPAQPLQPRWGEPVSVTWSEPMRAISASTTAGTPVSAWVDAANPTITWLQLGGPDGAALADGQTYAVRIAAAQGQSGIDLQSPLDLAISVPARPRFTDVPSGPVTLRDGDVLTLHSSLPLADVQVGTSDPDLAQATVLDDGIRVTISHYVQGAEADVDVASARSSLGAPLAAPVHVHVTTPAALEPPTLAPADGAIGVQPMAHPGVSFAEPPADPDAALNALSLDPPVDGHWHWASPTRAEFVPSTRLPINSDVHLTVHGGPQGPRSQTGGFLEDDTSATFRTTDFKRMDVSLSRQTMTLFEYDRPVRTISVATGVAAAPTPTGTFYVQYKAPQMRFRGSNPDGSRYDIPDVHWVLPFWGDYTIHGAYWRPRFGVPGSDGCVSMTDADAHSVYDWADVGTPLVIHS